MDAETLATGMIQKLGRRADYLVHPHILAHFKEEYYFPRVTNRRARSVWETAGCPSIADAARSRIAELKALPVRSIASGAQCHDMLKIEQRWRQQLI